MDTVAQGSNSWTIAQRPDLSHYAVDIVIFQFFFSPLAPQSCLCRTPKLDLNQVLQDNQCLSLDGIVAYIRV